MKYKLLLISIAAIFTLKSSAQTSVQSKDTSKIYTSVDKIPEFPGGIEKFNNYINVLSASKLNTGSLIGPVRAQFVIQKDGRLINPKITSDFGKIADTAIISIFRHSPLWTPGVKGGVRVATSLTVTLNFVSPMNTKPVNNADYVFAPSDMKSADIMVEEPNPQNSVDPKKIYNFYEQAPEFPGGLEKFASYLKENFNSPPNSSGINGRVILRFVVELDGSLTDVRVAKGLSPDIDKEAIRVISKGPKWHPGTWNSKPVRIAYLVHIDVPVNP